MGVEGPKKIYKKVVEIVSLAKCNNWLPRDKLGIGPFMEFQGHIFSNMEP